MLLRRCAWHKQYRGYGRLLGVSTWRGRGVAYSDGMCADCAARTRAAWQLPSASVVPVPRVGIPWATAAVSLAAAAVIFGIVVGPIERAVGPASSVAVVADATPAPAPGSVALPAPVVVGPSPVAVAPPPRVATAPAAPGFAPPDKRGVTSTGAGRGRIVRAKGRTTAAVHYPSTPEPETQIASLAEVDAEWSPNVGPVSMREPVGPPAALPEAAIIRSVEAP